MSRMIGTNSNNEIDGSDNADDIRGKKGDDVLFGNGGDDALRGNAGNDQMHGGLGNDLAVGGRGNDHLWGDDGADNLQGGAGRDTLEGGTGNDTLSGEGGPDVLTGGDGADTFVFKVADADGSRDTVTDFNGLQDHIDFSGLEQSGGVLSTVLGALTGVAGQIAVQVDLFHNETVLLYDQNGDKIPDLSVDVGGIVNLLDLVL